MPVKIDVIVKVAPKIVIPALLYGGGVAMGVKGAVLGYRAEISKTKTALRAEDDHPARVHLDEAIQSFNALRALSHEASVERMKTWLQTNAVRVEHFDVEIAPGQTIRVWDPVSQARATTMRGLEVNLLLTAMSADQPLQNVVFWAVRKWADSGTGVPIAGLHGAASRSAILAWLGNGSLPNGGAGMAGGQFVLDFMKNVPIAVVGGLVALSEGMNAKAAADAFDAAVDERNAFVRDATARVEALNALLADLNETAERSLDDLEASSDWDVELLDAAFSAVGEVGVLVATPVFEPSTGELTPDSAELLARHGRL